MFNKIKAIVSSYAAKKALPAFWGFLVPPLYLFLWVYILKLAQAWLGIYDFDSRTIAVLSLPILFFGAISKSTSWSIGGEKGIKGDTLGKYIKFGAGGKTPWDYTAYFDSDDKGEIKLDGSEKLIAIMHKDVLSNEHEAGKNTMGS